MPTIRQRLLRWSLRRFLHGARRGLSRDPSAARVRRDMARFERLMTRAARPLSLPRIDLGTCAAAWVDSGGADLGRVILYLHGGAFIGESPGAHCAMLARICGRCGARGFYVDYRLAPEHPYPAATDDCLAAYRHLLGQGIAPARIVIAGDSAGGNLALVTAMRARDSGLPLPTALVLLSPVLDATFSGGSMRRNDGLDPLFRASIIGPLASAYVPEELRTHPYVSPLAGDLSGLPPTLALVGSSEILLDDTLRLASLGQQVEAQVWHDMPHVFPIMHVLPEAREAIEGIAAFVARYAATKAAGNTGPSGAPH